MKRSQPARWLFFPLLMLFLNSSLPAQEQKAYGQFSGLKDKKAEKRLLHSARKEISYGNFREAVSKYSQLLKIDSTNAAYNLEMAEAYYTNYFQSKAIPYYERAIKYSKDSLGEVYYFLATAYHLDGKFEQAQKNYSSYLSKIKIYGTDLLSGEEQELKEEIRRKIEMCDNGKQLRQTPSGKFTLKGKTRTFRIVPAGRNVNSDYDDYGTVLTPGDSLLYFTSRKEDNTGNKLDWDDKFYEDIYVSRSGKTGWQESANLGSPINTSRHEAAISIAPDGKTLYFYRGIKQGTFFSSKYEHGKWSAPEILYKKSDINTKAWETSLFGFTLAGDELFVVSDRKGGMGGRDIYVTKKQPDGSWAPLSDIGAPINTKYDEDAPIVTADGNTLYFSSTGHNSMGGFDIFKSERQGDKWSEPVNLGMPFNTPGDDIYFALSTVSDRAYYSSNCLDTSGRKDMNIYIIDLCDDIPTTTLNGLAHGISEGTIIISEKGTGKQAGICDLQNGKYSVLLEHGKSYNFTLKTAGIEPVTAEISLPQQCKVHPLYQELHFTNPGSPLVIKNAFFDIQSEAGSENYSDFLAKADKKMLSDYSEISVNTTPAMIVKVDTLKKATLTRDTTGKTKIDTVAAVRTILSFNNVLFDLEKSTLKKEFLPLLDKAVALLKNEYPQIKFEVAGHTDTSGKNAYNVQLSKRRAKSVADYLASKGIDRNRMKVTGYGSSRPAADNSTREGRMKNRRTEIVVIR